MANKINFPIRKKKRKSWLDQLIKKASKIMKMH